MKSNTQSNDLIRKDKMQDWLEKNSLSYKTSLYEIILNVSDICNRKCRFCPRGNGYESPHQNKFMKTEIIEKICNDVGSDYTGLFSISGFGEPTLNPNIKDIIITIKTLCPNARIMVITNGDYIERLFNINGIYVEISMYEEFNENKLDLIKKLDCEVKIKDIEHNNIKLFNNRAGNSSFSSLESPLKTCCNIPFFKMDIDINGDVILCCSDWKREMIMGNIFESSVYDIWNNDKYKEVRHNLILGERSKCKLCKRCNVIGTLNGQEFVDYWIKTNEN